MFSILLKVVTILVINTSIISMNEIEDGLWDSDAEIDSVESIDTNEIPKLNGNELGEMDPNEMLLYDINNENIFYNETGILITNLEACEQVVVAAYKVADYVPNFNTDKQAKFWKDEVIPNLVESLTQDIRSRSLLIRSYSSIRDLSITIQKAWALIKMTKGSKGTIGIAQRNIPRALLQLEKCAEDVSKMGNKAIERFSNQTQQIFSIIGPEAAKYVEQRNEIETELNRLYDQQQKLFSELGERQGEVTKLSYMIAATEKHLNLTQQDFEEVKRRTEELNKLNSEIETAIQNIPKTIQKSITTKVNSGWWFWKRENTNTENIQVENKNRVSETKYYYDIISARIARLRETENDKGSKLKVIKDLNEVLSEQKRKYNKVLTELNEFKNLFKDKMEKSQESIRIQNEKMKIIDKSDLDTIIKLGLQGNTLINCLVSVRNYVQRIKDGTSPYAPLESILRGIKTMVENEIELLSSESKIDIFIAGNRLWKQVKFLSSYSAKARVALHTSLTTRRLH